MAEEERVAVSRPAERVGGRGCVPPAPGRFSTDQGAGQRQFTASARARAEDVGASAGREADDEGDRA